MKYSQDELLKRAKQYLGKRDKVFITEDANVFYVEHLGDAQSHANAQKIGLFQATDKGISRYGDAEHQADVEYFPKPEVDKEPGKSDTGVSTTAMITIDGEETEMSEDEIRAKLKELKIKVRPNTGLTKLAKKLNDALEG